VNGQGVIESLGRWGTSAAIRVNLVACRACRARRGQTRVESAVALGALIIAGVGAWMLYKDSIVETARAMMGFFASKEAG
jgi:hypothetical protein